MDLISLRGAKKRKNQINANAGFVTRTLGKLSWKKHGKTCRGMDPKKQFKQFGAKNDWFIKWDWGA